MQRISLIPSENVFAIPNNKVCCCNKVEGAIVECGVLERRQRNDYAATLKMLNGDKELFLYDTFEGMSDPTEKKDVVFNNESAYKNGSNKIFKVNYPLLFYIG